MQIWIKLMLLYSCCCFGASADFGGRWPRPMISSTGLCRYGARIDCCWGWTRRSWGQCQPLCRHGCKHGECVGPDQCRCHAGYAGKTCNQDLNECGLKPRPCKHRCMNTVGSYKCYCADRYVMMSDGTCRNARSCAMANCQYGCEVLKGEVHCQCPSPGLRLGPDGRTCVDVDECSARPAVCPKLRRCVNTFGSFLCKCHVGFELHYVSGKLQCIATPKVIIMPTKRTSATMATVLPGGHVLVPLQPSSVSTPRPTAPPHTPTGLSSVLNQHLPAPKPEATTLENEIQEDNPQKIPQQEVPQKKIPQNEITQKEILQEEIAEEIHQKEIPQKEVTQKEITKKEIPQKEVTQKEIPQGEVTEKEIPQKEIVQKEIPQKQRGDVHIPRNHGQDSIADFDVELGNTAEVLHADSDPLQDAGLLSCSFDNGPCDWIRDGEGETRWETARDPAGGTFLTISATASRRAGREARLLLLLATPWNAGDSCLSFRHKLMGHRVGGLQLFTGMGEQTGRVLWSRTGGQGWRSTQVTLWGGGFESVTLKGERRRGQSGEIAIDDISLRTGPCTEDRRPQKL
ncbi:nephronectin-like [Paramormyrops kingsleyae]|uniref:nephronectin-like n=1 Tax=Paramormyrops kingsleyae TaxID=1676925 RepID=UPI003B96A872